MQLRNLLDEKDAEVELLVTTFNLTVWQVTALKEEIAQRDADIAKKNAEITRFANMVRDIYSINTNVHMQILRLREREKKTDQEESPRASVGACLFRESSAPTPRRRAPAVHQDTSREAQPQRITRAGPACHGSAEPQIGAQRLPCS